ncbi:putative nuclease HARBI1 [Dermacentor andersoni]|uniref:putative nuclease HARBI1 n=1 Tax=Dermacentor andersoni TaxID=34620 RepID=UPI003B3B0C96
MADDMNGSAGSAKRAALLLLLDSDSSESESSSSDTSDCSDSDSDGETAAYEREFNRMFRIPAKRPKVVGFIEDVVRQYSDDEVSGMPDVVGCIDGSYIKIQCPEKKVASTYCNRHHYLSLTLQAVCDDKRRFLDAFIGSSSKMHDSHVFSLSPLSKKISAVCQGSYHLLGDAAYPLREHLLTPYRDYGALTKQQKHFNYKFSATRVLIENAFSTLKKRFRQLMYLELRTIPWLNKFIISCCVLHNLCIEYGDVEPDDDDNEQAPNDVQWQNCSDNHIDKSGEERALRRLGEIKRTKVLAKLL